MNAWNPSYNNQVFSIAADSTTAYVGGSFTTIGGQTRYKIAGVNSAGSITSLNITAGNSNSNVASLLSVYGNTLYVFGQFSTMTNQYFRHILAIDLSTGQIQY